MSLSENLYNLGALMNTNLEEKGIDGLTGNEGLTTLANKILDIEPSISGLDLDTSLVLHSSDDTCLVGQSIMFWAELKVDYDDETATDVDLSGVLTGATVEFKNGNTVLDTGVTDADGIAYYTHTFTTGGTYNISASFAGTENFDDCVSSSITVSVIYEMTITADKPILSFEDSDVATITATLSDGASGVSGETLSYEVLDKDENVLDSGSDVTDASGEISFTYQSAGVGDVQVIVYYGMFLQKTYVIEDCHYWNDGSSVGSLEIDTGVSCTSNGDYITITTSISGEKYVYLPKTLSNTDNFIFETEIAEIGTTNSVAPIFNNATWYGATNDSENRAFAHIGSGQKYLNISSIKNSVFKFVRENGTNTAYYNDVEITSGSNTPSSSFKCGYYTNNGRTQKIKNIKLKAL